MQSGVLRAVGRRARSRSALVATLALGMAMLRHGAMAQSETTIRIAGSNTIGEALMPALISGFAQSEGLSLVRRPDPDDPEHETMSALFGLDPVMAIDLTRRGSSTAFSALQDGEAEIGMASRAIKDAEERALIAGGAGPMRERGSEHVIALDGLAIIVARDNPLGAVTLAQAARIFSGEITNWSALGLSDGAIRLHARDDLSGTFDTFKTLVLEPSDADLAEGAQRYASNERLVAAVAADPQAIGFAPLASAQNAKPLSIALSCGIVVRPEKFSVKSEEYPLGRRLYLYTRGAPASKEARRLLAFVASEDAQPIISGVGFVNQSVQEATGGGANASERLINGMQAARTDALKAEMRRFVQATRRAIRLSPTFRFQPGGDLLDGKAVDDAERLARWLEKPDNAGRRILIAGFSDASGGFDLNKKLTMRRAEAVRRALLVQVSPGFDAARILADGFGPAAPIACDGDPGGDAANRRVEVWALPPLE